MPTQKIVCIECLIEKGPDSFYRYKGRYRSRCNSCQKEYMRKYSKQYRANNKEALSKNKAEYYLENKELISQYKREQYLENRDSILQYHRSYYENNKHLIREYQKINSGKIKDRAAQYRKNNSAIIKERKLSYYQNNIDKIRKFKRNYSKRMRSNISFRLRYSVSNSIRTALLRNNSSKLGSSISALPYTIQELRLHLESQFEHWMNWNNWGMYDHNWNDDDICTWRWQIDHIIPQSELPYSSLEDSNFKKCWSLDNLRPYSAKRNVLDGINRIRHSEITCQIKT